MTNGKFVVFEGIDGTGKGTLMSLAEDALEVLTEGRVHTHRMPGGSELGEAVRKILFETIKTVNIEPDAITMLFMANHVHDNAREVKPRLLKGTTVLSDRWRASNLAYLSQRPGSFELAKMCKDWPIARPDLTVLLVGDPEVMLARARGRGDGKQDAKVWNDVETQRRVQDEYSRLLCHEDTTLVVDTTWAPPGWTFERLILPRLAKLFGRGPGFTIDAALAKPRSSRIAPASKVVAFPGPRPVDAVAAFSGERSKSYLNRGLCGAIEPNTGTFRATCGNHAPCAKHPFDHEHQFGCLCCVTCGLQSPPEFRNQEAA